MAYEKATFCFMSGTGNSFRAGTKIGPIRLPGMEGTAGYLIALILALKGYGIRGVMGLDMPSNWISLHSGLSSKSSVCVIVVTFGFA